MADQTKIEWTDSTFNPWEGCTKVGPGCDRCYAEARNDRFKGGNWGPGAPRRRTSASNWNQPVKWNRDPFYQCQACGWRGDAKSARIVDAGDVQYVCCGGCNHSDLKPARRRVFCASLSDWLDNEVPISWLVDLLDLIRRTPNLDWLLLTKRIGNWESRIEAAAAEIASDDPCELRAWLWSWINGNPPTNVWLGATVVNQAEADRDVPKLLAVPARIRFLSVEPMLGAIDLNSDVGGTLWIGGQRGCDGMHHGIGAPGCPRERHHHHDNRCSAGIDWVIGGFETGKDARAGHPDWARGLRDQCQQAGVAFLWKQNGEFVEWTGAESPSPSCRMPDMLPMVRVGKAKAGNLLDGRQHLEWPC